MSKEIFIINSAIIAPSNLSVYSESERLEQTIDTLKSIDQYCPNNIKVLFDTKGLTDYHIQKLSENNVNVILNLNAVEQVRYFSNNFPKRSGEAIALVYVFNWLIENPINEYKRIYKISGRYRLNDKFKSHIEHVDSFVFKKSRKTWMSEDMIQMTGTDGILETRLWSFDSNLLNLMFEESKKIFEDCMNLGIDLEHSFYKNLYKTKKYKIVELENVGLCGNLAPTGELIDE